MRIGFCNDISDRFYIEGVRDSNVGHMSEKKGRLGTNAMKRIAAGAHLPTPWLVEPAKSCAIHLSAMNGNRK